MTNHKYFKTILLSAAIVTMGFCFTACDDDDPILPGTGIETAQWSAVNDADLKGQTLIYEFEAPASWTMKNGVRCSHLPDIREKARFA